MNTNKLNTSLQSIEEPNDNSVSIKGSDNSESVQRPNADSVQRFTKDERETILVYNEADGFWTIYSAVQSHIRKFDKLNYEVTQVDSYEDDTVAAKFYKVPKNAISFRDTSKKRNYTDEQRAAMSERARKMVENRLKKD